jgi:A/G-specific adenine glycosylase
MARESGSPERFPYRSPKAERPTKRTVVFVLLKDGAVWLRRRAEDGLLGGMLEAPSTPWQPAAWRDTAALKFAPVPANWTKHGVVLHGFTHFTIELDVWSATAGKHAPAEGAWCRLDDLDRLALPTLTRKVLAQALGRADQSDKQPTRLRAKSRIMTK